MKAPPQNAPTVDSLLEQLERAQAANASLQAALLVLSCDKAIVGGARKLIEKELELIKSNACGHHLFSELRRLRKWCATQERIICNHIEQSDEQSLAHLKAELAYLKLQRDALLDITWLDLPAEPCESTARWRELFNAGWMRRAEAASDPTLGAGSVLEVTESKNATGASTPNSSAPPPSEEQQTQTDL